jgi:hypothetical protein
MNISYAVIDDYGDNWEKGPIVHASRSLENCARWAEGENYHSASIVKITNGVRTKVESGDE